MTTQTSTTTFSSFDATDINLMLNVLSCDSENQEFLEKKWATLKALGDFTIKYLDEKSMPSPELEGAYIRFLTKHTNTYFRSLNISDINLMLNALSMRDFRNQEFFEKKLATLEALKEFSIQYIDIESMSSRESKAAYIRFLSKITDNIESLEILTGKITTEQLKAASQSFARKWESAVSIID